MRNGLSSLNFTCAIFFSSYTDKNEAKKDNQSSSSTMKFIKKSEGRFVAN
jgi:hypothetical protein